MSNKPISDNKKKIQQLEERKRQIEYAQSEKQRKERAHRLIRTGAIAESYFNIDHLSLDDREEVFKMFADFVNEQMPYTFKKE